jgi:hypothetical protein
MCECIKRIEGEIKEKCQKDYRKPIHAVACAGKVLSFDDGKVKLTSTFTVELEGQKKAETVRMAHTFCPWCGEKQ